MPNGSTGSERFAKGEPQNVQYPMSKSEVTALHHSVFSIRHSRSLLVS